jgi:hypothetical protein
MSPSEGAAELVSRPPFGPSPDSAMTATIATKAPTTQAAIVRRCRRRRLVSSADAYGPLICGFLLFTGAPTRGG